MAVTIFGLFVSASRVYRVVDVLLIGKFKNSCAKRGPLGPLTVPFFCSYYEGKYYISSFENFYSLPRGPFCVGYFYVGQYDVQPRYPIGQFEYSSSPTFDLVDQLPDRGCLFSRRQYVNSTGPYVDAKFSNWDIVLSWDLHYGAMTPDDCRRRFASLPLCRASKVQAYVTKAIKQWYGPRTIVDFDTSEIYLPWNDACTRVNIDVIPPSTNWADDESADIDYAMWRLHEKLAHNFVPVLGTVFNSAEVPKYCFPEKEGISSVRTNGDWFEAFDDIRTRYPPVKKCSAKVIGDNVLCVQHCLTCPIYCKTNAIWVHSTSEYVKYIRDNCEEIQFEKILTQKAVDALSLIFEPRSEGLFNVGVDIDRTFIDAMEGFTAALNNIQFEKLNSTIASSVSEIKNSARTGLGVFVGLMFMMFLYVSRERVSQSAFCVMTILVSGTIFSYLHGDVLAIFRKYMSDFQKAEPEMDVGNLSTIFSRIIFLLGSYMYVGDVFDYKNFSKISFVVSQAPRFSEGAAAIVGWVFSTIQSVVDWCDAKYKTNIDLQLFNCEESEVNEWCKKVQNFIKKSQSGEMPVLYTNGLLLNSIKNEAVQIQLKYAKSPNQRVIYALISRLLLHLKPYEAPFESACMIGNGPRQPLTLIMLRGKSGSGKTHMQIPFLIDVLKGMGDANITAELEKNYNSVIYSRMSENVYWDGYVGQPAIVFDDVFQLKDVAGMGDNEWMNIIRAVSCGPWVVHMADISQKGNTLFKSLIGVASSNMYNLKPNSIIEVEAIKRRFALAVDVVPRVQFCKAGTTGGHPLERRLDKSLVSGGFNPDIYEIFPFNPLLWNDTCCNGSMTYHEFVDHVISYYKGVEKDFLLYAKHLKDSVTPAKSEMDDEDVVTNVPEIPMELIKDVEERANLDEIIDRIIARSRQDNLDPYEHMLELFCPGPYRSAIYQKMRSNAKGFAKANIHFNGKYDDLIRFSDMAYNLFLDGAFAGDIDDVTKKIASSFPESTISDTIERWFKGLECLKEKVRPAFTYLPVLLTVLGTSVLAMNLYNRLFPSEADDDVINEGGTSSESLESDGAKKRKARLNYKSHQFKKKYGWGPSSQVTMDKIADTLCDTLVHKSLYEMVLPGKETRCGMVMFVSYRNIVMPRHFLDNLKLGITNGKFKGHDVVTLRNLSSAVNQRTYAVSIDDIVKGVIDYDVGDRDMVFCTLPKGHVPSHVDTRSWFLKKNTLRSYGDMQSALVSISGPNRDRQFTPFKSGQEAVVKLPDGRDLFLKDAYLHHAHTDVGDCGSILVVNNPTINPGKLLGIHVAGSMLGGFVCAIHYEDVEMISKLSRSYVDPPTVGVSEMRWLPHGDFSFVSKIDKGPFQPRDSKLTPTPLYGLLDPPTRVPAMLEPFVMDDVFYDPYFQAVEKYGVSHSYVNLHKVDAIVSCLYARMQRHVVSNLTTTPRLYSFEECCVGVPSVAFVDALPRSTSCGYPDNIRGVLDGKTHYFGRGETYDLTNPNAKALFHDLYSLEKLILAGIRPEFIFTDVLKDELRPMEKVLVGKTRLVSASPLRYSILCRRYFMDFSSFIMRQRMRFGSCVGINPYGEEWGAIALALRKNGGSVVAGDFSAFDANHSPAFMWGVLDLINRWYDGSEADSLMRARLWEDLVNSKHVYGKCVYEWHSSLPSGHFLTSILNSVINVMYFMYCWGELSPAGFVDLESFFDETVFFCYGDDNIWSVSPTSAKFFNPESVSHVLKSIGQTYTDAHDKGQSPKMIPLSDATFLKRTFRYENTFGQWVAPLDLTSVLETIYWCRDKHNMSAILLDNIQLCFDELSLHGEVVFNEYVPRIIRLCNKHGVAIPSRTTYLACLTKCVCLEYM